MELITAGQHAAAFKTTVMPRLILVCTHSLPCGLASMLPLNLSEQL
uniref:Uncharacterized protein n=1 Tax=Anguilla anguilla TaxID=7936 RepID=A0A0E9REV0_ANGAN